MYGDTGLDEYDAVGGVRGNDGDGEVDSDADADSIEMPRGNGPDRQAFHGYMMSNPFALKIPTDHEKPSTVLPNIGSKRLRSCDELDLHEPLPSPSSHKVRKVHGVDSGLPLSVATLTRTARAPSTALTLQGEEFGGTMVDENLDDSFQLPFGNVAALGRSETTSEDGNLKAVIPGDIIPISDDVEQQRGTVWTNAQNYNEFAKTNLSTGRDLHVLLTCLSPNPSRIIITQVDHPPKTGAEFLRMRNHSFDLAIIIISDAKISHWGIGVFHIVDWSVRVYESLQDSTVLLEYRESLLKYIANSVSQVTITMSSSPGLLLPIACESNNTGPGLRQSNAFDCGVFAIAYVCYAMHELPLPPTLDVALWRRGLSHVYASIDCKTPKAPTLNTGDFDQEDGYSTNSNSVEDVTQQLTICKGLVSSLKQSLQQCNYIRSIVGRVQREESARAAQLQELYDIYNFLRSNAEQASRYHLSVEFQGCIQAELTSRTAELNKLPGKRDVRMLDLVMQQNRVDTAAYTAECWKLWESHRRMSDTALQKMKRLEKQMRQASCLDS